MHRSIGNRGVRRLLDAAGRLPSPAALRRRKAATAPHRTTRATGPHVQRALASGRFAADPTLVAIEGGTGDLQEGAKGLTVTRIQQALADVGLLLNGQVTGTFGAETTKAVKEYQSDEGITESGIVDQATMRKLDEKFKKHKIDAGLAEIGSSFSTRDLTSEETAGAASAISTEVKADPKTGKLPDFQEEVNGQKYGDRLKAEAERILLWQWEKLAKGKEHKPEKLHPWKTIERVATVSKQATDAVFSGYKTGPPLKQGTGIHDAWDYKIKQLKKSKGVRDAKAAWRVRKIVQASGGTIGAINREHGAVQSRGPEKKIIEQISSELVTKHYNKLLWTHVGWGGFSAGGQVYLQRFKGPTAKANREFLWSKFFTIIHEYLHTLEHPDHIKYREGMGEKQGNKTLREGVVEYCTHIAIDKLGDPDPATRKAVEGEYHDKDDPYTLPAYQGYAERKNAEDLAGIVGPLNVFAAFFKGETSKIGDTS